MATFGKAIFGVTKYGNRLLINQVNDNIVYEFCMKKCYAEYAQWECKKCARKKRKERLAQKIPIVKVSRGMK
ncbi:MAG: hypothetical protein GY820_42760 [Gammaproteobacteria bacterium]|nr:hypothetical protein [Gammaproteobacteria bacterium]